MSGLIEVSALFKNCARRRGLAGLSPSEVGRRCQADEPSEQPLYRPPFVTPSVGASEQAVAGVQEPSGGPEEPETTTGPSDDEEPSEGLSEVYGSRWGGSNLTPGTVPAWRDGRTEAHVWANEMVRVGQRPPFNQEGWGVHATRMGLSPEGIEQGWDYIERVFSKKYERRFDRVAEDLTKLLGEGDPYSGGPPPYGGYYASFGHAMKMKTPQSAAAGPSFPFYTKAAKKVYAAARKIIAKNPNIDAEGAYRQAMGEVGVNTFEMTPEDDGIMGIALHWEIVGKEALPEPPAVATQRATSGMKGTQIGYGREIMPRGAP